MLWFHGGAVGPVLALAEPGKERFGGWPELGSEWAAELGSQHRVTACCFL